jgi:hypothetical protein
MTTLELLTALKTMSVDEQLEILEATSKIIRERLGDSPPKTLSNQSDLAMAAEKMRSYYAEGNELTGFVDRNTEDFYEYSEYA